MYKVENSESREAQTQTIKFRRRSLARRANWFVSFSRSELLFLVFHGLRKSRWVLSDERRLLEKKSSLDSRRRHFVRSACALSFRTSEDFFVLCEERRWKGGTRKLTWNTLKWHTSGYFLSSSSLPAGMLQWLTPPSSDLRWVFVDLFWSTFRDFRRFFILKIRWPGTRATSTSSHVPSDKPQPSELVKLLAISNRLSSVNFNFKFIFIFYSCLSSGNFNLFIYPGFSDIVPRAFCSSTTVGARQISCNFEPSFISQLTIFLLVFYQKISNYLFILDSVTCRSSSSVLSRTVCKTIFVVIYRVSE